MHYRKRIIKLIIVASALLLILSVGNLTIVAAETNDSATAGASDVPALEMAPGEFLPISVKLTNFGSKEEINVTVNYEIQDGSGKVFYRWGEEVPVKNTISYVKNIPLPITLPSGQYFALSKINYHDQTAPAVSKFEFTVNRKVAGFFLDQLAVYGLVILFVGAGFFVLSRVFIGRRARRLVLLDYSEAPKENRPFFELISDIIADARKRHGDRAIEIAAEIDGLVLDEEEARVLNVNKEPAEIIALLILKYEKTFKKKIKYQPRKKSPEMKKKLKLVEENLAIARKYFE